LGTVPSDENERRKNSILRQWVGGVLAGENGEKRNNVRQWDGVSMNNASDKT